MKLHAVRLENFRGYKERVEIPFGNLTAIVGKNDQGKSTILEAMEVFFNPSSKLAGIDQDDGCKFAGADASNVRIECLFSDVSDDRPPSRQGHHLLYAPLV